MEKDLIHIKRQTFLSHLECCLCISFITDMISIVDYIQYLLDIVYTGITLYFTTTILLQSQDQS